MFTYKVARIWAVLLIFTVRSQIYQDLSVIYPDYGYNYGITKCFKNISSCKIKQKYYI